MIAPHNGKGTFTARRRKASIEIYFVLYLSAIVLLLGTTRNTPQQTEEALLDSTVRDLLIDFDVAVERVALVYTIVPTGLLGDAAASDLKRDSVNVVRARGSVSDVRFDVAQIRDTSSGKLLPIESATIEREGTLAAMVRCSPNRVEPNKVYEITVAASAMPAAPPGMTGEKRARIEEILRGGGRVHDTVTFTISVFAVGSRGMIPAVLAAQRRIPDTPSSPDIAANTVTPGTSAGSGIWLEPGVQELRRAAGSRWSNTITISGVGNAATELEFRTEPAGIRVGAVGPNKVELHGTAPRIGQQQVVLTAVRRSDRKPIAVARFLVAAAQFPDPQIPELMYVDQTYSIDMSSRDVPQAEIETDIIENGRARRHAAVVTYRPSETGRVQIYRVHNGQRIEPSYSVEIAELPRPVIQKPVASRSEPGTATVTTVSYGTVNGRQNAVNLRVYDGNAEEEIEQIDSKYDPVSKEMVQRWRIRRRTSTRDFIFTLWAIDLRGSRLGTRQTYSVQN